MVLPAAEAWQELPSITRTRAARVDRSIDGFCLGRNEMVIEDGKGPCYRGERCVLLTQRTPIFDHRLLRGDVVENRGADCHSRDGSDVEFAYTAWGGTR